MADELNIFAVDSAMLEAASVEITTRTRGLLGKKASTERVDLAEWLAGADADDVVEWLFACPDGVRLVATFPHEGAVIEDLEQRVIPHLSDERLMEALIEEGGRLPPDAGDVVPALAVDPWKVFMRDEMAALPKAIRQALDDAPEWGASEGEFAPEWRGFATEIENAREDLFVWAYWN